VAVKIAHSTKTPTPPGWKEPLHMGRLPAPSELRESTKAIFLHRIPMIAVLTLHRTALAIMQAELFAWRSGLQHNARRIGTVR
jgi:hypothetical protein